MKKYFCLLLLVISILVFAGCSSDSKITGIKAEAYLYDDEKLENAPYKFVDSEDDKTSMVFEVNTYFDFAIVISPTYHGSKVVKFTDVNVDFDDLNYCSISKVENATEPTYLIKFYRDGKYELNYSCSGFKNTVSFECKNDSSSWDKYKMNLNDLYPWISDVKRSELTKIKFKHEFIGVAPGNFNEIYYSTDSESLNDAYNFLSSKVIKSPHEMPTGGNSKEMTYYIGDNSQSIKVVNGYVFADGIQYQVLDELNKPEEYIDEQSSFVVSPFIYRAKKSSDDPNPINVDYLEKIEFKAVSEENIDSRIPIYYIEGLTKLLFICSNKIFNYDGVFYQIYSDTDFSSLFN